MPKIKTEKDCYWVDKEGHRRSYWWNDTDEALSGHITENQFKESRIVFTLMLEKRKYQNKLKHIRNLKRLGKIPKSYPDPIKPRTDV